MLWLLLSIILLDWYLKFNFSDGGSSSPTQLHICVFLLQEKAVSKLHTHIYLFASFYYTCAIVQHYYISVNTAKAAKFKTSYFLLCSSLSLECFQAFVQKFLDLNYFVM